MLSGYKIGNRYTHQGKSFRKRQGEPVSLPMNIDNVSLTLTCNPEDLSHQQHRVQVAELFAQLSTRHTDRGANGKRDVVPQTFSAIIRDQDGNVRQIRHICIQDMPSKRTARSEDVARRCMATTDTLHTPTDWRVNSLFIRLTCPQLYQCEHFRECTKEQRLNIIQKYGIDPSSSVPPCLEGYLRYGVWDCEYVVTPGRVHRGQVCMPQTGWLQSPNSHCLLHAGAECLLHRAALDFRSKFLNETCTWNDDKRKDAERLLRALPAIKHVAELKQIKTKLRDTLYKTHKKTLVTHCTRTGEKRTVKQDWESFRDNKTGPAQQILELCESEYTNDDGTYKLVPFSELQNVADKAKHDLQFKTIFGTPRIVEGTDQNGVVRTKNNAKGTLVYRNIDHNHLEVELIENSRNKKSVLAKEVEKEEGEEDKEELRKQKQQISVDNYEDMLTVFIELMVQRESFQFKDRPIMLPQNSLRIDDIETTNRVYTMKASQFDRYFRNFQKANNSEQTYFDMKTQPDVLNMVMAASHTVQDVDYPSLVELRKSTTAIGKIDHCDSAKAYLNYDNCNPEECKSVPFMGRPTRVHLYAPMTQEEQATFIRRVGGIGVISDVNYDACDPQWVSHLKHTGVLKALTGAPSAWYHVVLVYFSIRGMTFKVIAGTYSVHGSSKIIFDCKTKPTDPSPVDVEEGVPNYSRAVGKWMQQFTQFYEAHQNPDDPQPKSTEQWWTSKQSAEMAAKDVKDNPRKSVCSINTFPYTTAIKEHVQCDCECPCTCECNCERECTCECKCKCGCDNAIPDYRRRRKLDKALLHAENSMVKMLLRTEKSNQKTWCHRSGDITSRVLIGVLEFVNLFTPDVVYRIKTDGVYLAEETIRSLPSHITVQDKLMYGEPKRMVFVNGKDTGFASDGFSEDGNGCKQQSSKTAGSCAIPLCGTYGSLVPHDKQQRAKLAMLNLTILDQLVWSEPVVVVLGGPGAGKSYQAANENSLKRGTHILFSGHSWILVTGKESWTADRPELEPLMHIGVHKKTIGDAKCPNHIEDMRTGHKREHNPFMYPISVHAIDEATLLCDKKRDKAVLDGENFGLQIIFIGDFDSDTGKPCQITHGSYMTFQPEWPIVQVHRVPGKCRSDADLNAIVDEMRRRQKLYHRTGDIIQWLVLDVLQPRGQALSWDNALEHYAHRGSERCSILLSKTNCYKCAKEEFVDDKWKRVPTSWHQCDCGAKTTSLRKTWTDAAKRRGCVDKWLCIDADKQKGVYKGQTSVAPTHPEHGQWVMSHAQTYSAFQGLDVPKGTSCMIDLNALFGGTEMLIVGVSRAQCIDDLYVVLPRGKWDVHDHKQYRYQAPSKTHVDAEHDEVFPRFDSDAWRARYLGPEFEQARCSAGCTNFSVKGKVFETDMALGRKAIANILAVEIKHQHPVSDVKHVALMEYFQHGYIEVDASTLRITKLHLKNCSACTLETGDVLPSIIEKRCELRGIDAHTSAVGKTLAPPTAKRAVAPQPRAQPVMIKPTTTTPAVKEIQEAKRHGTCMQVNDDKWVTLPMPAPTKRTRLPDSVEEHLAKRMKVAPHGKLKQQKLVYGNLER